MSTIKIGWEFCESYFNCTSTILFITGFEPGFAAGRSSGEDDFKSSILLILFNCTSHVYKIIV